MRERYIRWRDALVDADFSDIPPGWTLEEWFTEIEDTLTALDAGPEHRPSPHRQPRPLGLFARRRPRQRR